MTIQNKMSVLAAVALFISGSAAAADYTVWLKDAQGQAYQINNVKCATGTMNSAGAFTMNIAADCFAAGQPAAAVAITGNGTLNTAMIKSKDELPVSSADGITFSGDNLTLVWSSNAPAIGTRGFSYVIPGATVNDPSTTIPGTYHLVNNVNSVPEPETLLLSLIGLAGLALTRRKRK